MQKFEMPKMSVEEFEVVDVIMTASFEEEPSKPVQNETPEDWD